MEGLDLPALVDQFVVEQGKGVGFQTRALLQVPDVLLHLGIVDEEQHGVPLGIGHVLGVDILLVLGQHLRVAVIFIGSSCT